MVRRRAARGGPVDRRPPFARTVAVAVGITILLVALALLAWQVADVLLVVFAGVLLAVFLGGLADLVTRHTRLGHGPALAVVVVLLVAIVATGAWLLAGDIAAEARQLRRDMPRALESLRASAEQHAWGQLILGALPSIEEAAQSDRMLSFAPGAVSRAFGTTVGLLVNVVVVAAIGIYVAAEPGLHARGVLHLVPRAHRARAGELLRALRRTLQWWLIGKVIVMIAVGVVTGVALALLGVPLALTLGLIAGLLDFVPYAGPILAFGPAILLALTQSTSLAVWVLAVYALVQILESYLLTPLVQKHAVALPPALTIAAQLVMTVLFGPLGLLLATPLTAVALVTTTMLYVEDALDDRGVGGVAPDAAGDHQPR